MGAGAAHSVLKETTPEGFGKYARCADSRPRNLLSPSRSLALSPGCGVRLQVYLAYSVGRCAGGAGCSLSAEGDDARGVREVCQRPQRGNRLLGGHLFPGNDLGLPIRG